MTLRTELCISAAIILFLGGFLWLVLSHLPPKFPVETSWTDRFDPVNAKVDNRMALPGSPFTM